MKEHIWYIYDKADDQYLGLVLGKRKHLLGGTTAIEVSTVEASFLLCAYENNPIGENVMARNYSPEQMPDDWVGLQAGDDVDRDMGPFQVWLSKDKYNVTRSACAANLAVTRTILQDVTRKVGHE